MYTAVAHGLSWLVSPTGTKALQWYWLVLPTGTTGSHWYRLMPPTGTKGLCFPPFGMLKNAFGTGLCHQPVPMLSFSTGWCHRPGPMSRVYIRPPWNRRSHLAILPQDDADDDTYAVA